ncbi:MAG: isochorismatase family protein [Acidobacteria bacterium]|nr:isochorismatase family protein [Acidobacteriota bacterium]
MEKFIPRRGRTALLVIDVQERLAAVLDQAWLRNVVVNIQRMLQGMEVLGCPAILTEQYPRGLGATVADLQLFRQNMPVMEKMAFSCCRDLPLVADLQRRDAEYVLLTGMETHVCVLQTALDLLAAGRRVHVLQDAVISRTRDNWRAGLELMRDAGAVISTTEIALFQLQETSGTASFKQISKLVK